MRSGRLLARSLTHYDAIDAIVLGLAHGGLVVADAIASTLGLQRDVWVPRKLALPTDPDLVFGAIAEGAALVLDRSALRTMSMTQTELRALVADRAEELAAEARKYRRGRLALDLHDKTVILVDDGVQTGGALSAAIDGVRRRGAAQVVISVPVGAEDAVNSLRRDANELVCLATPRRVRRIGAWYQDYRQVSDGTVMKILDTSTATS